ncbi:MAG: aminoglycoside phosphotransferase family protein [Pseudomonadota bacterium]
MLSKLRHFSSATREKSNDFQLEAEMSLLQRQLGLDLTDIKRIQGGTLGLGFIARINGQPRFLKTHTFEPGRQTLKKEWSIFSCLYQSILHVEAIDIEYEDEIRFWLIMDSLSSIADLDTKQAYQLIKNHNHFLAKSLDLSVIPNKDNFELLIKEGQKALLNLTMNYLISNTVQQYTHAYLHHLKTQSSNFPPHLCHGDFSPSNVMLKNSIPILIDWEDAFWGIEDYDYLYWLTFIKNRQFLSSTALASTAWDKHTAIAIMVLIIIIKCEISFLSGSYINNKISFDKRIMEVINIA